MITDLFKTRRLIPSFHLVKFHSRCSGTKARDVGRDQLGEFTLVEFLSESDGPGV